MHLPSSYIFEKNAAYNFCSKPCSLYRYRLDTFNIYLLCLSQILTFVYKSLNSLLPSHCTISLKQLMSTVIKLEVMNMICILIMLIRSVVLTGSVLAVLNTGSFSTIIVFNRYLKKHLLSEFVWYCLIIKFCHSFTMLSRLLISLSLYL